MAGIGKVIVFGIIFVLITGMADAAITSVSLVEASNISNSISTLRFDENSSSYADFTMDTNRDAAIKICSDSPSGDLLDKYTGLAYSDGNVTGSPTIVRIDNHPIIINSFSGSCAYVNIDLSKFGALYPGYLNVMLSDDLGFSSYSIHTINQSSGFLMGDFNLTRTDNGDGTYTLSVDKVIDDNSVEISVNKSFLVISTGNQSAITKPGSSVTLAAGSNITVNQISPGNVNNETTTTTTTVSGGGGGRAAAVESGKSYCEADWRCMGWLACEKDNKQRRDCIDYNLCEKRMKEGKIKAGFIVPQRPAVEKRCKYIPPASCFDKVMNQNEQGVDCGGVCVKGCVTAGCLNDLQCEDGFVCKERTCVRRPANERPAPLKRPFPILGWVLLGIAIFVGLAASIKSYIRSDLHKHRKAVHKSRLLEKFIIKAIKDDHNKKEIRSALLKEGWDERLVKTKLDKVKIVREKKKKRVELSAKIAKERAKDRMEAKRRSMKEKMDYLNEELKKL